MEADPTENLTMIKLDSSEVRLAVLVQVYSTSLTMVTRLRAMFWYNHANDGEGARFGTNEADIILINTRIGAFWNFHRMTPVLVFEYFMFRLY